MHLQYRTLQKAPLTRDHPYESSPEPHLIQHPTPYLLLFHLWLAPTHVPQLNGITNPPSPPATRFLNTELKSDNTVLLSHGYNQAWRKLCEMAGHLNLVLSFIRDSSQTKALLDHALVEAW
jgi:hypothetical protein